MLITADGKDRVFESIDSTYDECVNASSEMGSRWIFYPFHFIIKDVGKVNDNQRIITPPDDLPHLKGKSINTVTNYLKQYGIEIMRALY